jgi:N-acetylated-alpha-linked acidic dipeptidase
MQYTVRGCCRCTVIIETMPRAPATFVLAIIFLTRPLWAAQHEPDAGREAARPLFFPSKQWRAQREFERAVNAVPDPRRLRAWHDLLASEPHVAGTEGDQRVIEAIAQACGDMGLEVQIHEFWALLCEPIDAKLEIVGGAEGGGAEGERTEAGRETATGDAGVASPEREAIASGRRGVIALPLTEDNLLNDPFIAHPGLSFGWNAYSGSGDVTASVVYANYGTKEDFETLKSLGVDCTGKIVLARYGGNYRGFKAKYAEQAGAAGLIIYTDPDDAGYRKGVTYPEGGWANDTCIQRGSIVTLDQPGDPLTPGIPATEHAQRLDPDTIDLPRIPVQPIGYRAAQQIVMQMTGRAVPEDLVETWQGGLPCAYRLTGGDNLTLRLMVKQKRTVKRSANVIATLRGSTWPDEKVIIGSHHDAWGFGAGDPASGTILVLEAARSFTEMAALGEKPARSIDFCFWGAEEFGIIGSTEYCEQFSDELKRSAVAYINLDGAAMGPNFSASSDPLLKTLIEEVARCVPQARDPARSVFEAWKTLKPDPARAARPPSTDIGDLGGGSDHIGFYCHLGIPSCYLSSGGAPGTAYHSNYDNLAWYRHTVGEDYEPALMLTRIVNLMISRLANAQVPPLDASRYAGDLREHVKAIAKRAEAKNVEVDFAPLLQAIDALKPAALAAMERIGEALTSDERSSDHQDKKDRAATALRSQFREMRDVWTPQASNGLPGRPWFRNQFAASDPDAGYASWMLPALRGAIEVGNEHAAAESVQACVQTIQRLTEVLQACASDPQSVDR